VLPAMASKQPSVAKNLRALVLFSFKVLKINLSISGKNEAFLQIRIQNQTAETEVKLK
jgi:hypothetical protein